MGSSKFFYLKIMTENLCASLLYNTQKCEAITAVWWWNATVTKYIKTIIARDLSDWNDRTINSKFKIFSKIDPN